ncbi:VOC family protein [Sphaerisporangium sp. TRM90804]|uniref:VOC family protein n=1 Tax=Sphaerisporangium sp. TRM90804 TaxID=3031113 RepID=UPI0024484BC0|nr:VOC family protein [Sphaerisporangium sp. TRM90804]MDH2425471.1 VOC family protein [Sphaerisporangium sp. TRM90804]
MLGRKLTEARWTHVALPSSDLDAAVEFYTTLTPLVVVSTHHDKDGRNAWLSNDKQVETPFVLVLVEFAEARGVRQPQLAPFAHLGMEVPSREDVDAAAARGRELGCLHWEPMELPPPVGYVCALKDPDGNVVEISHDQRVFEEVRTLWSE